MVSVSEEAVLGKFHRRGEAASHAASLIAGDGAVRLLDADGAELANASATAVAVSDRVGAIPRRLTFPDGGTFVTDDNDGIDRLLVGQRGGLIHRLERFHPRLVLFVVATLLLLFGMFRYGIPVLASAAVAVTPASVPLLLGQGTLVSLDQAVLSPSETVPADRAAIEDGFDELIGVADEQARNAKLLFRDGGLIGPNAFALPDGTVVVTDQLIKLSKTTDQVIGVLAHEIAHVEGQHSLKQLYRYLGIVGMIALVTGDMGEVASDIMFQGGAVLSFSYSRDQEREADVRGAALLRAIGRDPIVMAEFFELLLEKCPDCGEESILSTHPGIEERIETLKGLAAD